MYTVMSSVSVEKLPIRTVAALTGVNAITLRAWERRYGLIRPVRTPKGQRLYTHEDVERIRRVLALVERGVPISQTRALLDVDAPSQTSGSRHSQNRWRAYLERMTIAVTRFDESELDHVYDEALSVHPIEHVTKHLLLPLLAQLGERWKSLTGAIAEEHFFTTYLRSKLGARIQQRMRYSTGPRIIVAGVPGERHEIGMLLFALEARMAGLHPIVLGADTPFEDLVIAQRHSGSKAIVISSSIGPAPGLLERELPNLVRQAGVPVFLGGATAKIRRPYVAAAGAIPVGTEIEDAVRLIAARVGSGKSETS
jgi:DNA-binding transcriptional MerR regulator